MPTFSILSIVAWFIHILRCIPSTLETLDIECGLVGKLWTNQQSEGSLLNYITLIDSL